VGVQRFSTAIRPVELWAFQRALAMLGLKQLCLNGDHSPAWMWILDK
jgi:hypothetical protein